MGNNWTVIRGNNSEDPEERNEGDLFLDEDDDEVFILTGQCSNSRGSRIEYAAISITGSDTFNGWQPTKKLAIGKLIFLGDDCEVTVKSTR